MRKCNCNKFSLLLNIILILFLCFYFLVPFLGNGVLTKIFSPCCAVIKSMQGADYLPPWCLVKAVAPVVNHNLNANVNTNTNAVNVNSNVGLANPSAVKCQNDDGQSEAYTTEGGEAAICIFNDKSICEQWAYFRGECKPGQCQKVCQKAGTANEGWYNSCTNELLKLAKCAVVDNQPGVTAKNIEVSIPVANQQLSSPFKVEGRARVFENQVNVRVKGKDGKTLITETTIVKSPDAGEWGDFSLEISYDFNLTKEGFVEVYSSSAKDGSEENLVSIPVKF